MTMRSLQLWGLRGATWFQLPRFSGPAAEFTAAINNQNGVIVYIGYDNPAIISGTVYAGLSRPCVKLAAVTDGTSNTFMYSESAHGMLNPTDQVCWNWRALWQFRPHELLHHAPHQSVP